MIKVSHFKWVDSEGWGVKLEMVHSNVDYSMNILLDADEVVARQTAEQLELRFRVMAKTSRAEGWNAAIEACAKAVNGEPKVPQENLMQSDVNPGLAYELGRNDGLSAAVSVIRSLSTSSDSITAGSSVYVTGHGRGVVKAINGVVVEVETAEGCGLTAHIDALRLVAKAEQCP